MFKFGIIIAIHVIYEIKQYTFNKLHMTCIIQVSMWYCHMYMLQVKIKFKLKFDSQQFSFAS